MTGVTPDTHVSGMRGSTGSLQSNLNDVVNEQALFNKEIKRSESMFCWILSRIQPERMRASDIPITISPLTPLSGLRTKRKHQDRGAAV